MKSYLKAFLSINLFFLFFVTLTQAQSAARSDCFPFEKLPPEQRKAAEDLLLKALDSEALYTIVGGLKPISGGFHSFQAQENLPRVEFSEAEKAVRELGEKKAEDLTAPEKSRLNQARQAVERKQTLDKIAETKNIFAYWRCGDDLFADVQHYARVFDGKRHYDTTVFSRSSLRQKISEKADFFSRLGILPNSHPLEVLYAVEYNETSMRFAGYGYLFGYPDYAVRFFVQSSDEERITGKFVERSFVSLPTVRGENRFVYAVPKNHIENEADKALRAKAEPIFNEYKRRRAEYIGEGKKGVVEMMRDWFCNAQNQCSMAARSN
jgi:hypothetical protein